jgi:cellulose synthase (UDP-forming)
MTATMVGGRHRRNRTDPPPPPSSAEKYSRTWRAMPQLLSAIIIGTTFILLSQMMMETYHLVALPFVSFTFLYVSYQAISLWVNFTAKGFDLAAHKALVASWGPEPFPGVDILLPVYTEPPELLANTWRAVASLIAAYPGAAVPYVLDDGNKEETRLLAAQFGFTRIVRPDRRFNKSGNLRHAFGKTSGEFFMVLDADFAPSADFLAETMPYFDDPKVAIVQTPQYFRTSKRQCWVERGAASLQEIFFRAIQVTRNHFGASMCVGSNVVYRRRSMENFGGITEVSYAEDVHTGIDAIRAGGRLVYIPVVLAAGLCPDNVNAYARQQYRWGAGTLSVGFTRRMWTAPLPLRGKLAYFSGSVYNIYTAVAVFITPMIPLVMLSLAPATIRLGNCLILLPALLTGFVLYPLWHMNDYRLRDALPLLLLRGWANALAIWDYSRGKIMGWQPSGGKVSPLNRLWWGIRLWNGAMAIAWVGLAAWRIHQTGSVRFALLGTFGVIYMAVLARVLFPGREAS